MARIRTHLRRAPIIEALIDFQVRPKNSELDLDSVRDLAETVEGYERKGPVLHFETTWAVTKDEGTRSKASSKELGVRLHSSDEKYVLQVRTNGFTLSRLEPYETWEKLVHEARRLWNIYIRGLEPEAIIRVATRFINRLKLPMKPGEAFEQYLTRPPEVADELPQEVQGFTQRIVLVHPELKDTRANLIMALQENVLPQDHVPVIST